MSSESNFDIIIVGAGPAGATCALHLMNSGLRIALFDQNSFPRFKLCGGAISDRTINAIKRLPGDIYHDFLIAVQRIDVDEFQVIDSELKKYLIQPNKDQYGYIIDRMQFDKFLISQIQKNVKVNLFENHKIIGIREHANHISVESENQTYTAKLLILGTGAKMNFKFNSFKKIYCNYKPIICYEKIFQIDIKDQFKFQIVPQMFYPADLLPCYFWLFPGTNNKFVAGLGKKIIKGKANETIENTFERHFKSILSMVRIKERFYEIFSQGAPITIWNKKQRLSGNRFLLCGDAASLADPVTGEGIGNAMLSGELAAKSCIYLFDIQKFDSKQTKIYDKAVFKRFGNELKRRKLITKLMKNKNIFNFLIKLLSLNTKFLLKKLF